MHATRTEPAPEDVTTPRATVDRVSTMLDGPCPRYAELVELEALLRAHINLLLAHPAAAKSTLRDGVHTHLQEGMGAGLMSAHPRSAARPGLRRPARARAADGGGLVSHRGQQVVYCLVMSGLLAALAFGISAS